MDWFLYDNGPHHERVKQTVPKIITLTLYEAKYSRMDQVKFVEDSLFLKAVFHKFHLVHS